MRCDRRKYLIVKINVVGFGETDNEAFEEFRQFGIDNYNLQQLIRNGDYEVESSEPCGEEDCENCKSEE